MGRRYLQDRLLARYENMAGAAEITAASKSSKPTDYMFHTGRVTAFNDCIRELKIAMKEAE